MLQRRKADPAKRRQVRRDQIPFPAKKAAARPVEDSSSSSSESEDVGYVRWFWANDSVAKDGTRGHQDVFEPYKKEMCLKLEEAYSKNEKEMKVDSERFIDLQNMLQRRYDDPMKRRMVKRDDSKVKKKPAAAAAAAAPAKRTASSSSSDGPVAKPSKKPSAVPDASKKRPAPSSSSDDDTPVRPTKKARPASPPPAPAPSVVSLIKAPKTWTNQTSMAYNEVDVAPGSAEWIAQDRIFLGTIDDRHKGNTANHKVAWKNLQMTRLIRIENPMLWLRYVSRKEEILRAHPMKFGPIPLVLTAPASDPDVNEYYLYHGLNASSITGIAKFGFDPRYCSLEGMFGAGLYFAENSSKSSQYCHAGACTASGFQRTTTCNCKKK
eukprot:TRINITY_DN8954_c0_g1_i1.p1 TRINITY_DN8954_c0_g1~~TRINITY_DN8954_c0_g1_i1.p1  ORF type:complete len:445 (-),score=109.13 TRINITY_DN8954_c0_g1_i1:267-1406(-)